LNSTGAWGPGSRGEKKNKIAQTVEDKAEHPPPEQLPEEPVAAEQGQDASYGDQRGFEYGTKQPSTGYHQYGVAEAEPQGYEHYYGQTQGPPAEPERSEPSEVAPPDYGVLDGSDRIEGRRPTENLQQEVEEELDLDPFDERSFVVPPRQEDEEEGLPEELPVDFEGGLSEDYQQLAIQTEDEKKEEGTSMTNDTITSAPTEPPAPTRRPVRLCGSCDKSVSPVQTAASAALEKPALATRWSTAC
jgi:hypothetical protein